MINSAQNDLLYSNFKKPQLYSNNTENIAKLYNAYNFGNDTKINNQPNQDTVDIQTKKKRFTKKNIAIAVLVGIGLISTTASIFANRQYLSKEIDKLLKTTSEKFANAKASSGLDKVKNAMSNFTNIKDDYWDRFTTFLDNHGISFLKNAGNKLSDFYKKISLNAVAAQDKEAITKLNQVLKKHNIKIDNIVSVEELIKGIDKDITAAVKENRITKNLINKNIFKRLTDSNIADNYINNLSSVKSVYKPIQIPKNAPREVIDEIHNFNKTRREIFDLLIPKFRDINVGSAPTDIITQIIIPGVALGVAVHNADSKEEKKSIKIDLGIPIITSMITTTYGLVKLLSGAVAMTVGLSGGFVISRIFKLVANKLSKIDNNETNTNKKA